MKEQGSILLMILVMMALFLVLMLATSQLISTQYRQTVAQEEREQTFHVAEAGIRYALWLLNTAQVPPAQLVANPPAPQTVTNQLTGAALGTFTLTFSQVKQGNETTVTITSLGTDSANPTFKQTIVVTAFSNDNKTYAATSWDHRL